MKALNFVDAFTHSADVRDALRDTIRLRVGIDVDVLEMMRTADAYDATTDQIVVGLQTTKHKACMQIVRDLMLVYYINQWLVSFCTEPEWSPYP